MMIFNDLYEQTHGTRPRGRGTWAFCPRMFSGKRDYLDHTVVVPYMTLRDAKRWFKMQPQSKYFKYWDIMP